ncbi:MAG TPA: dihydroorotase [Anaerovoracaceae bacterium]|nr:dihydroorotase [Anaerovoracaceae bacterium]
MKVLLKNGNIFTRNGFRSQDVFVSGGRVFVRDNSQENDCPQNSIYDKVIDCNNMFIVPGFVDVHVHLREPGFFYKETIATGTAAAAHGGYTCVCPMPNLDPVPSTLANLRVQLDIIDRDAHVKVIPYGTITREQRGQGQLALMEEMAPYVIGFSDDGKGVQGESLMEEAMLLAKKLNKPIAAHCEDETLLFGGYIHKGRYAAANGHKGICSESEWVQAERDIDLAAKTGVQYHICHVSTKETVELVRAAKARGVNVTCETAPHYLVLCEEDLQEDGRFKMNPPLRSEADKAALIEGIKDGTVDMIATDHAPHSLAEKSKGLAGSAFGIVGLETSFPVLYTELVGKGIITLERLIDLMAIAPRRVFGLDADEYGYKGFGGYIEDNQIADLAIIDLNVHGRINPSEFLSKGRSTPFEGMDVDGQIVMTMVDGDIIWER